jgi:VanZ family protein
VTSEPGSSSAARPSLLLLWAPVALYAVAIFIESSISQIPALPSGFSDKDGHGLLYAGLAVLTARALWRGRWAGATLPTAVLAIVLTALYGATDEFHQWFVPGRTADVMDWLSDLAGASVGTGLAFLAARAIVRRRNT